jgi:hypothetical protein
MRINVISASECPSMHVYVHVYGGGSPLLPFKCVTSLCRSYTCPSVHHKSPASLSGMCGEPSDTGTSFSRVPGLFPAIFIPPVLQTSVLFTIDATDSVD